jgi:hypothetical protein
MQQPRGITPLASRAIGRGSGTVVHGRFRSLQYDFLLSDVAPNQVFGSSDWRIPRS